MKELDLRKYLKKYSKTQVDFYRFNGNYGDSLIWHGTTKLLTELDIEVNYVDLKSGIKNEVLFIDGGGNFVDYYSDVRDFLEVKCNKYKKIIILPHTINGNKQKNILAQLRNNCVIFCREEKSYEFVKKYFAGKLYLWHDCAFYNDFSSYKKYGQGVLNAFRQDCESIQTDLPDKNIDISRNGWCKKPLDDFLGKISNHSEVRTDRLHVAIAATLLGKKTIIYPNSYYKNLAVYSYSLKSYPNAIFLYADNENMITQKNISRILGNAVQERLSRFNVLDLFSQIKHTNHKLWKLEDITRDKKSNFKTISCAKKEIDRINQQRNDIIAKIDVNLSFLLKNKERSVNYFVSESLGVLVDKLSIFYIRINELEKILSVITDDDSLLETYKEKLIIVSSQINYLELYLKKIIRNIKENKAFFKTFEPVKVYNDPKIRDYISKLADIETNSSVDK